MILNRNYLHTNAQRRELPEQGMEMFDLTANEAEIHQFPGSCISLHWHSELEIFVLLEGDVEVQIGEKRFRLTAGEGCFINIEILHSYYAVGDEPCHFRSFVFDAAIVSGMPGSVFDIKYVRPLLNKNVPFIQMNSVKKDKIYFEQFDIAFKAAQNEGHGYEFVIREALTHILLFLSERCKSYDIQSVSVQEIRLKQMLEWINKNIEKNISLPELAKSANISARECQRIFKKYLQCRPVAYIQKQRILIAVQYLTMTDDPITDIALKCGFSSPSYFTSQFKNITGETPTEYRNTYYGKQ